MPPTERYVVPLVYSRHIKSCCNKYGFQSSNVRYEKFNNLTAKVDFRKYVFFIFEKKKNQIEVYLYVVKGKLLHRISKIRSFYYYLKNMKYNVKLCPNYINGKGFISKNISAFSSISFTLVAATNYKGHLLKRL